MANAQAERHGVSRVRSSDLMGCSSPEKLIIMAMVISTLASVMTVLALLIQRHDAKRPTTPMPLLQQETTQEKPQSPLGSRVTPDGSTSH